MDAVTFSIRAPQSLRDELDAIAIRADRSRNYVILALLEQALEQAPTQGAQVSRSLPTADSPERAGQAPPASAVASER